MVETNRRVIMENKTPKIGGYISPQNAVTASPVYNDGNLKLNVDASLFTPGSNAQVANNTTTNVGVTTANTTGSNKDVNSSVTNAGALASLSQNTENATESVLSTPAAKSPVAGETILSAEDQYLKELSDAVARGDYQGMINAYIGLGNVQNQDYSAEIDRLTQQREEKIRGIDDQYLFNYNELKKSYDQALRTYNQAVANEDTQTAQQASEQLTQLNEQMGQLINEQSVWRDQVGYESAMQSAKQRQL